MQSDILTKQDVRDIVSEEIKPLKDDIDLLKIDMSLVKSDVSSLKTDVSSLKTDVSSLRSEMVSFREEIRNSLQEQTTMLLGAINDMFIRNAEENRTSSQVVIEQTRDQVRVYGDMYSENRADIKSVIKDYQVLDSRVTKLEISA